MQRKPLVRLWFLVLAVSLAHIALHADTLRLKNGEWVDGTYAGGNASSIRFNVNGSVRTYPIADVAHIQFGGAPGRGAIQSPTVASSRMVTFSNDLLTMSRPEDWQAVQDGDTWVIAPRGGEVRDSQNRVSLAYGVTIGMFNTYSSPYDQRLQSQGGAGLRTTLRDNTDALVDDLRQANPNLRTTGTPQNIRVDGQPALSLRLSNDSPNGGLETDWLVTTEHQDGIVYILFTAPEREFRNYEPTFQQMLNSIRWNW